ncbi:adenosylcobinamide-phosphate synthase CbiB [Vibrio intestinalis]|uniref:adenosylcobinamide-phosphate synthase CbiB n=1 Tax=Vibrio intestinalis TaxID=2933291 RepID=UPI0021A46A36|nr:adenosylcobinamide-phosphate synthase CbiB [Vibrio intestinalis]
MFFGLSLWQLALSLTLAFLLDKWLAEPKRFHPLIGFGNWANWLEARCRGLNVTPMWQGRIAWFVAVVPLVSLIACLTIGVSSDVFTIAIHATIVYLCLGAKSLEQHAMAIYTPLNERDLASGRAAVQMIVSRDANRMDEEQISIAAVESVLENGNDAVIATLFWGLLFGAPGAVLFRLANTLDAMWGYQSDKYLHFGRFTAKTDDWLGYLPARITAFGYVLLSDSKSALECASQQAGQCSSPNGGLVMCAGAGGLNIQLGGKVSYHGEWIEKPPMGKGQIAQYKDIPRACHLLNQTTWLVLGMVWAGALLGY